jgi:hypothetical protein
MPSEQTEPAPHPARLDERRAVTERHIRALLTMQLYPTAHTQRIVEELSFLPDGGQQWRRDLQIRLPTESHLAEGEPFIVALGMMKRSRFADFRVQDAAGRTLPLLTRMQHGYALTTCLIFKYLFSDQITALRDYPEHDELHRQVFAMFTSVDRRSAGPAMPWQDTPEAVASTAVRAMSDLLLAAGVPEDDVKATVKDFAPDVVALMGVTQYLCWVPGRDGETVSLSATYTMSDAPSLSRRRTSTDPTSKPQGSLDQLNLRARWHVYRTGMYARSGLGPVSYELRTPTHDHAGSYYLLIKPPKDTRVTYLDWGLDNSIDDKSGEVDCAFDSVHIHNGSLLRNRDTEPETNRKSIPGSAVQAFLRADPRDHWPLVLGAVINVVLALLAQRGQFVSKDAGGISTVLLLAPTALLAYLAQQQRHYYAHVTGWLAFLMWGYLALNIVFIVSVEYDLLENDQFFSRPDFLDDLVSASVAVASGIVVAWFIAVAVNEPVIRRQFRRNSRHNSASWLFVALVEARRRIARRAVGARLAALLTPPFRAGRRAYRWYVGALPLDGDRVDLYGVLERRYGDRVVRRVFFASLLAAVAMILLGWGTGRSETVKRANAEATKAAAAEAAPVKAASPLRRAPLVQ